jgi:3'-5' exoribonuclease
VDSDYRTTEQEESIGMPRTMWISDLKVGQNVHLPVHIVSAEVRNFNGGRRLDLTLCDKTGTIQAVLWNVQPADLPILQQIRFANVCGDVKEFRDRPQLALTAPPQDIGTPADLSDYLACSPIALPELETRLFRHIDAVENGTLHALLLEVFQRDTELSARFKVLPAAVTMHHAFRHGLLHHTLEVTDLVASMSESQSRWGWRVVNRDLAITGALLHDIGKAHEIDDTGNRYRFSAGGELLGHIALGLLIVARAAAKVHKRQGFPKLLEVMVLHLIASHHGKGEWGSPEPPKTMEALLLHMADKTSADLFYFHEAAAQAGEDDRFAKQFKLDSGFGGDSRRVFVGDIESLLSEPANWFVDPDACSVVPRTMRLPVLRMVHINWDEEAIAGMRVLPLVGHIAAGTRVLDAENLEEPMLVEAQQLSEASHYLLRVKGDSMTGDGIEDGDILVVRQQETADPHAIVVAQVPTDGAVVKRLERTAAGIRLLSSNPAFPPIQVPEPGRLRVQGLVVGIARY